MFGKRLLHILALATAVLVVWSVVARPSGAHGPKVVYRVRAYDTLWTIAQAHYGGDVTRANLHPPKREKLLASNGTAA